LAVPLCLANLPLEMRGRGAGIMFTGVGIGIAASGTLVPMLARQDLSTVWLGIAALGLMLTFLAWRSWGAGDAAAQSAPADSEAGPVLSKAVWLLLLAYGLDAFAFVPHTVFWVDFIARGLGRGLAEGGSFWVLYGVGALCGPILAGLMAEKLGFQRAVVVCFFIKAVGLLLPVLSTARPSLAVSAMLVGALTPGISAITSGRVAELVGAARHRMVWGWMTTAFAVAQAASAYGLGFLFTVTHSYLLLYLIGGILLIVGGLLAMGSRR
ncbi:YbfB/YjiJ family MFS transporter, partial [Ferrovibrio sp.]